MNYSKVKLLILITFFYTNLQGQSDSTLIEYEVGVMYASNIFVKIKGEIKITDSIMKFTFGEKVAEYKIVKSVVQIRKYLLTDGIDEFTFTISENKGKIKGYEHSLNGTFEIRAKNYNAVYLMNKKE